MFEKLNPFESINPDQVPMRRIAKSFHLGKTFFLLNQDIIN
tara:strand:- start:225 stop:347 length:123 start_codon:yes stop_codon:yes gene_type:complete